MRGEQNDKADSNGDRVLSSDDVVIVRPRKASVTTAYLVDEDGNVIYHLVSAWWLNLVIFGSVLMIAAILIVSFLAFYNGYRINQILSTPTVKEEIQKDE